MPEAISPHDNPITPDIKNKFDAFIRDQIKTSRLIEAAVLELRKYPESLRLAQAVDELRRFEGEDIDDKGSLRYEKNKELIADETEKGFPFFYGLAAVSCWGSLEVFVEDVIALCLEKDLSLMSLEQVSKIKISLSKFQAMPQEQRTYYIIDTIERDIQSKYKRGVSRFESLLRVFGLGGEVDDDVKKNLLELSNVRNVLVHRSGVADERLVINCPWLGLKLGEATLVNKTMFSKYFTATTIYAAIVFRRVSSHFGGSVDAIEILIQKLANISQR
jgi:hypothetical protein